MTEAMLIVLVLGMVFGYYLGRVRAERLRAKFAMRQIWDGRKGYREGPFQGWRL